MIPHSKPTIDEDDIKATINTLKSGMIASGEMVKELERKLCEYIGGVKAKATCTGRSALVLGLLTLGIGEGDEVILPTYVCHSVMDAVAFVGANPVIVDIGDDYCIDPEEVKRHITSKTKAIIVVHIFGISAKIKELKEIAEENSLYLIEDCAQAIGGDISGRKLGSFGDFSIFSFQATKVIATGEGGMCLVNNFKILENFEKVIKSKGEFFQMSDIQASLGVNQLNKLDDFIEKRRKIAKKYMELLNGFPLIYVPVEEENKSIFFRFPVRVKKDFCFDSLRKTMESYRIHIRKGVDKMLHQIVEVGNKCPNADLIFKETISLPIYPSMKLSDLYSVVSKIKQFLGE